LSFGQHFLYCRRGAGEIVARADVAHLVRIDAGVGDGAP
jgi:hypothetical protein